jgi:hypothetical protein
MHDHGITLPAANTTRPGLIFNLKGLRTGSPRFQLAALRCRSRLNAALGRRDHSSRDSD